ncbi:hypothetical protein BDV93DRAFT_510657 [Ceratobasidium sp. AG-I]|nr:hypothetical protein BDV93DRAFT_510657 [Ceratobasidium sp. AG-I]
MNIDEYNENNENEDERDGDPIPDDPFEPPPEEPAEYACNCLSPPPEEPAGYARDSLSPPPVDEREPRNATPTRGNHGYAMIEYLDEDGVDAPLVPENPLRQKEWFELAEWLSMMPLNNQERARYFEIERHKHGLPWQNLNEFYRAIDTLEHGPDWSSTSICVSTDEGEETFVVYKRNPVEIVRYLIGLERLNHNMKYGPERHWTITINGHRIWVYSEMGTGEWWWRMQDLLSKGATIAPIILATDQTQLSTLGGDKSAWPVYQSIGNISKSVRRQPTQRAMLLVGYIPVAKLPWITNKKKRGQKQWEVYHELMAIILELLKTVSVIGVEMCCADSGVCHVYPIVAAHIGNWPEQCTIACSLSSRCPICVVQFEDRGSGVSGRLRTKHETLQLLRDGQRGCVGRREDTGLWETWPFWADLPWVNRAATIVPNLLHQMLKGVVKYHIVKWWAGIMGANKLNQCFSALPCYAGLRHFRNGVTSFTQWTGTESKMVACTLLLLVAGSQPSDAVGADNIAKMDADLIEFHDYKDVFCQQQVLQTEYGWNGIPKFHMIGHYTHSTCEMGTPDGYNTKGPERLHKDYVKFYYPFSSRVNAEPQLALLLQREEAWGILQGELEWAGVVSARKVHERPGNEEFEATHEDADDGLDRSDEDTESNGKEEADSGMEGVGDDGEGRGSMERGETRGKEKAVHHLSPFIQIAATPTHAKVLGTRLIADYGASDLIGTLQEYVQRFSPLTADKLHEEMLFQLWSRFSLHHDPIPFAPLVGRKIVLVRASPPHYDQYHCQQRQAHFDTVLLADSSAPDSLHYAYNSHPRQLS